MMGGDYKCDNPFRDVYIFAYLAIISIVINDRIEKEQLIDLERSFIYSI